MLLVGPYIRRVRVHPSPVRPERGVLPALLGRRAAAGRAAAAAEPGRGAAEGRPGPGAPRGRWALGQEWLFGHGVKPRPFKGFG